MGEFPSRANTLADPATVVSAARQSLTALRETQPLASGSYSDLREYVSPFAFQYFSLCALSRRKHLDRSVRSETTGFLFEFRSRIEHWVRSSLIASRDRFDVLGLACGKPFFGESLKQGVSIRYALASCAPTPNCSGGCYAHDGRDRHLHQIMRGAVNWFLGTHYEAALSAEKQAILDLLSPTLNYGVRAAIADQHRGRALGFERSARIRFSHVGEMAANPHFTNDLARAIRTINPEVSCVVYTRHPNAIELDPDLLNVNFSLEGDDDPRKRLVPPFARAVASAWGGRTVKSAEVNFLEHHAAYGVNEPSGDGFICPVTLHHAQTPSCDEAKCDVCFRKPIRRKGMRLMIAQSSSSLPKD